MSLGLTYVS